MSAMKISLFITGSSGFIGSNFLKRINLKNYNNVFCLDRNESEITTHLSEHDNFKFIKGSIYDFNTYKPYLASSDIVVHLAAVTGKARPDKYFNVNAKGTEFLTKQCEQLGVHKFLYISSIAVKFNDISKYYYAQSKQQGEDAVKNSNLNYTIVRPTIVIGKESPIWQGFSKLAKAPITPIFGDGTTKIQPIYIEDLIDCILSIINENIFLNEALDLGGPEEITIENFLEGIQEIYQKKIPRIIHIPLRPIISILSVIEKRFSSVLPLTVGQLSSFRYDGTIEKNRLFLNHLSRMKNIQEMLMIVKTKDNNHVHIKKLISECTVFCTYLMNQKPNNYIVEKYQEGHIAGNRNHNFNSTNFDKLLVKIAKTNSFFTRLADIYTHLFYKRSVLQKKLMLLLAVLESCAPTYYYFDSVNTYGKTMLYIKIFQKGLFSIFILLLSMITFMPLHVIFAIISKKHGR